MFKDISLIDKTSHKFLMLLSFLLFAAAATNISTNSLFMLHQPTPPSGIDKD
ncbi:AgrD family cyclic lactone autoinducer peptide [Candidatus Contubernalis alkalaceticus]|uniref:AgrD family cyclic lactone autoinducer peptide n=1 Tax=Candidatus Contubernalis alkaliaceticus TaxID=338645 RepID=UPI00387ECA0A|nr:cyclic lactone autoinducer peptide [Candidatus Contubernalis alkalaceticus]